MYAGAHAFSYIHIYGHTNVGIHLYIDSYNFRWKEILHVLPFEGPCLNLTVINQSPAMLNTRIMIDN